MKARRAPAERSAEADHAGTDDAIAALHGLADALITEVRTQADAAIDAAAETLRRSLAESLAGEAAGPGRASAWALGAGIGFIAAAILVWQRQR